MTCTVHLKKKTVYPYLKKFAKKGRGSLPAIVRAPIKMFHSMYLYPLKTSGRPPIYPMSKQQETEHTADLVREAP